MTCSRWWLGFVTLMLLAGCGSGTVQPLPQGSSNENPAESGNEALTWEELAATGEVPDCAYGALGENGTFQVLVFEDLEQSNSDVQGRVAVGGDATLENFYVGELLPFEPTDGHLVVGDDLMFRNGQVLNGAIVYGTSATLENVTYAGYWQGQPFDFAAAQQELVAQSAALTALNEHANGQVEVINAELERHELRMTGSDAVLNLFEVSAEQWSNAYEASIEVPEGSTVLVNVMGTSIRFSNLGIFLTGATPERVMYHFPEATELYLESVQALGSVFAPQAAVSFPQGLLIGQLIALSLSGNGQSNLPMFAGCLPIATGVVPPPPPPPPPPPVTTCTVNAECPEGLFCMNGGCCEDTLFFCDPNCVDISNDPNNCSGCGNVCSDGQACVSGSCMEPPPPVCQAPFLNVCDFTCVDFESDPAHCGNCDNVCDLGLLCINGTCVPEPTPQGDCCALLDIASTQSVDLIDYQVPVNLQTAMTLCGAMHLVARVGTSSGPVVDYCFVQQNGECAAAMDNGGTGAWLKVPAIGASGVTSICFTPSAAPVAVPGAQIFELYDDFRTDLSSWSRLTGSCSNSSTGGPYVTDRILSTDPVFGWVQAPNQVEENRLGAPADQYDNWYCGILHDAFVMTPGMKLTTSLYVSSLPGAILGPQTVDCDPIVLLADSQKIATSWPNVGNRAYGTCGWGGDDEGTPKEYLVYWQDGLSNPNLQAYYNYASNYVRGKTTLVDVMVAPDPGNLLSVCHKVPDDLQHCSIQTDTPWNPEYNRVFLGSSAYEGIPWFYDWVTVRKWSEPEPTPSWHL